MGRRRSRLIKKYMPDIKLAGVDSNAQRRKAAAAELGIDVYDSLRTAVREQKADTAFVCCAPLSHASVISECLDLDLDVFTEINVISDGYAENISKANEKGRKIFLSSTFLYRREIQYIIDMVHKTEGPINYIYHTGQYLPDWHPWESFKSFFVNEKRTNGCREIFSIEMPWLLEAFGTLKSTTVLKDKMSGLDIGFDDNYIVAMTHENGCKGVLCVDVVARKAQRSLEIYSENLHLFWGGPEGQSLRLYDIQNKELVSKNLYDAVEKDGRYAENIIENPYIEEILCCRRYFEEGIAPVYDMAMDAVTLKVIDAIEGT
jgi:predicted dehydrogenase